MSVELVPGVQDLQRASKTITFTAAGPGLQGAATAIFTVTGDVLAVYLVPFCTVDLTQAEIIIAVGRGIKAPENLELAKKLATLLGGEIGASRPICDEGWLPMERQIGSSGQTVAPKLYLALGISGAIQHVVGMKGARTIVAVNKDAHAPIFDVADYGIVADLFEVVPALIEALEKSGSA